VTSATDKPVIVLRPAVAADAPLLAKWDGEPHVIACVTDDPEASTAFEGADWNAELAGQSDVFRYSIAIDPAKEPYGYWGPCADDLRALDIWIGEPDALGQGYGTEMMIQAVDACFARPEVQAIVIDPLASNAAAHRFYQRLGFIPEGRRLFNEDDDCLVHRLTRADWEARS
jgi:aminoglycoside 6'-N-acetyltransferase